MTGTGADTSDSVRVVVGWDDEAMSPTVDACTPGEWAGEPYQHEVDVPRALWESIEAVSQEYRSLLAKIVEAAGVGDGGALVEPCDRWTGDESHARTWYRVEVPASGKDNVWPVGRPAAIGPHHDTREQAEAWLNLLPDRLVLIERTPVPVVVSTKDASIVSGGFRVSDSDCHHCGRPRPDHPGEPKPHRLPAPPNEPRWSDEDGAA